MTKNIHCTQEIILKIRYFERGLLKSLKKVNFIFSFEPSPFNGQDYRKQKEPGVVTSRSSGYKTSSEKFLN